MSYLTQEEIQQRLTVIKAIAVGACYSTPDSGTGRAINEVINQLENLQNEMKEIKELDF
jgi:hypothetical protein